MGGFKIVPAVFLVLLLGLGWALPGCNSDSGGIFCYEHRDLGGRWRRDANSNVAGWIGFNNIGFIENASPEFAYLIGKRAQVSCGGDISGDMNGYFEYREYLYLEGYWWNKY